MNNDFSGTGLDGWVEGANGSIVDLATDLSTNGNILISQLGDVWGSEYDPNSSGPISGNLVKELNFPVGTGGPLLTGAMVRKEIEPSGSCREAGLP